ncbi:MAG: hypothetical protein ACXQTF_04665, partial [Candidatus Hecatellaceae archaeon]
MKTSPPLMQIVKELGRHAPFTVFGATTGVAIMLLTVLFQVSPSVSSSIFYFLHPLHVVLSALVTSAIYLKYSRKPWMAVWIGYVGSVGIATMSDVISPYLGGTLLNLEIEFHLPFIEKWWLVNPLAFTGIAIGCWKHTTRLPHSGHVLLSTWTSLFYFTAFGVGEWLSLLPAIFLFLFLSVWLPCCLSDIVFPLLFVPPAEDEGT